MKFFKGFALLSAVAVASYSKFASSTATDITTEIIPLINAKRSTDLGDHALSALTEDADGKTALTTLVGGIETNECAVADHGTGTGYSRTVVSFGDTETASQVVDLIYAELSNYNCVYPPTADSLKGSVDNFTIMMNENATTVACSKTTECTTNANVAVCYFAPVFAGDANTPFAEKAVFDAIVARDDVCSGTYFAQFSGVFLSLAALSIGSSYILA